MSNNNIQGLILAGGPGLRLDPISTPKPLVCVGVKPLIIWTIEYLQQIGLQDIWIVVGRNGDAIRKEILGNPLIESNIHFIEIPAKLDSMFQSLAYAVSQLKGSLLVTPCDLFFEKYPLSQENLDSVEPDSFQVFASPVNKDHSGHQLLLQIEQNISGNAVVKDVGIDIPNGNYRDMGIYLVGENAKNNFDVNLDTIKREDFYPFLKALFNENKAEVKVTENGKWWDVNTSIDKIKADLLFKQKSLTSKVSQKSQAPLLIESEKSYHFPCLIKKTTEVIVKSNILKNLWEYDLIASNNANSNHFLITDNKLYNLLGKRIEDGFKSNGYLLKSIIVPEGEESKTVDEYWRLIQEIIGNDVDRSSIIINLGGGSINNVAGFVASTIFRGISLWHIPTTLLAQLDSTIDIKHAINTTYGKNQVGSFYGADKVIVDPAILTFLSEDHIINGLSEAIKHGLVQDPDLFEYFNQYNGDINNPDFLEKVINWTIDLKIQCMGVEPDGGLSDGIKDYGHGLGHALEQYTAYEISHGQAIAVGMCLSAEISLILDIATVKEVDMHYEIFNKYDLATSISPNVNIDDFLLCLKNDKTYMQGSAFMGLIENLGRLWNNNNEYNIPVDLGIVRRALEINQEKYSST
jgi:3-dehydroquinate synthase